MGLTTPKKYEIFYFKRKSKFRPFYSQPYNRKEYKPTHP